MSGKVRLQPLLASSLEKRIAGALTRVEAKSEVRRMMEVLSTRLRVVSDLVMGKYIK